MKTTRAARELFRAFLQPEYADRTDGQLLAAFVERRDAVAFEVLVHRHGPKVLGVCRRVIGQEQDAEDAFQATFLVLAHKAAMVQPPDGLAGWLYGVARNTALKARELGQKRRRRERSVPAPPEPGPVPPTHPDADTVRLLEAELARLPEAQRTAILLCDVDGLTQAEAGRRLGVPEGTVSSRLARARQALADRLKKRGVVLAVPGALATLATGSSASAQVPQPLLAQVVEAAVGSAAGCLSDGVVIPPAVLSLQKGVLYAMLFQRLKRTGVAVLLALGVCTSAALLQTAGAAPEAQPPGLNPNSAAQPGGAVPGQPAEAKKPAEAGKKVAFTIKNATIEELSDEYSLVTVSYPARKAVGNTGLVQPVDKIPEKPDIRLPGGSSPGYLVRNKLVNILVADDAKITDETGKKIKLRNLAADLAAQKGARKSLPVTVEIEADERGLVIVGIAKNAPFKYTPPKDLNAFHTLELTEVDLKAKTITVVTAKHVLNANKPKPQTYDLDEKFTVTELDLNEGPLVTRALKPEDLKAGMKIASFSQTGDKDNKKLVVSRITVLKELKPAKDEKPEEKK